MDKQRRSGSFLREVMIVVLGVLVALGLEEAVHHWREQQRLAEMRAALDKELADFAAVFGVRIDAAPCIEGKLDALDALLRQPDVVVPPTQVGRPPYFFSSRSAWNEVAAELLGRHAGPVVARSHGEIYQGVQEFDRLSYDEQADWARLATLESHQGPLDAALRWRLLEAVASARNSQLLLTAIATQLQQRIESMGVQPDAAPIAAGLERRPICLPLDQVDPAPADDD